MRRSGAAGKVSRAGISFEATQNRPFRLAPCVWAGFVATFVVMDAPRPLSCFRSLPSVLMPGAAAEPIDPAQDFGEQRPWHRDLGELEHHVAAVPDDPPADLDQLLAQGRQRPLLDLLG
jgi:hypothetical protein